MDGELNETTPKIYSSMWGSTPNTVYEATTSTNINSMTRDMDVYQERPKDTSYFPHPSWQTVQREKEWDEWQKQFLNQNRPSRPPWEKQWQPPQDQEPQNKQQWQSARSKEQWQSARSKEQWPSAQSKEQWQSAQSKEQWQSAQSKEQWQSAQSKQKWQSAKSKEQWESSQSKQKWQSAKSKEHWQSAQSTKQQWESPQSQGQKKRMRQRRRELEYKYKSLSMKDYANEKRSRESRENKIQEIRPKLIDSMPETSNSALTWAEAVSSLSIEDPNAVYDPSEPTITEFDLPHEDSVLDPSIADTVEYVSPYLEVAIVSVPATDLTEERSKIVDMMIGDLAESWAASSISNDAIAFIGAPMYSEKDIGLYLRCQNGETIRWLEGAVASLDPLWDGCKLRVRKYEKQAKLIKCLLRLPMCSTNLGLVCRALRGFNPSYHVQSWEFYSFQRRKQDWERGGCFIVIGIPEDILVREILPNQRRVRYRLRTCILKFFTPNGNLVNKYPPIDKVDSDSSPVRKENTSLGAADKTGGSEIKSSSRAVTVDPAKVKSGASAQRATESQTSVQSFLRHKDPSTYQAARADLSDRSTERMDATSCETKDQTNVKTQSGSTKKKKEPPKPRWWNPELEEKRRWMRHLFNRAKNTRKEEDWLAHKQAQNEYKKMVRSSKFCDFELIRD